MARISKSFFGRPVNDGVDFEVQSGEIHALLGENGAGKTTLMNILAGLYRADSGTIRLDGQVVDLHSPADALARGIGMVHQQYKLVPSLTAAENLLLGLAGGSFRLRSKSGADSIEALSERYRLRVELHMPVRQLSMGQQQRIEILKALHRGASVLILDEPTAVLTPAEVTALLDTMRQVAAEGRTVIFITHKLREVVAVADRVTVLRTGRVAAGAQPVAGISTRELARLMVGSAQTDHAPRPGPVGAVRLRLEGVHADGEGGLPALRDVSLTVCEGEIVGVAAVAGNGQMELAQVVAGVRRITSGQLFLDGRPLTRASVRQRAEAGLACIPQDRLTEGLAADASVGDNAVLRAYPWPPLSSGPVLRLRAMAAYILGVLDRFQLGPVEPSGLTRLLSGGQQQRLLLARELAGTPSAVLASHPSRGLDVAAGQAARQALLDCRDRGAAILLISEDLDEVLELSNRVAVMDAGRVLDVLPRALASRDAVGLLMVGQQPDVASRP